MRQVQVEGGTFVVVSSGFADGPAQPLVRHLAEHGAHRVVAVAHPLLPEDPGEHRTTEIVDGVVRDQRTRRLPSRPPLTYALDPLVPVLPPRADAWIGFNCLASAQGIAHRSIGRAHLVLHWNVDFVPDRFGPGLLTRVYDRLDAFCCRRADGRVELSAAALSARRERYGLAGAVPVEVIPMGAWTSLTPTTEPSRLADRRVVFLGHLVERMGVDLLIDAVSLLRQRAEPVRADIIGGGPRLELVRDRVRTLGLTDLITVHGFLPDFTAVEQLVARAVIGVAPYEPSASSFTRFADPGKLKVYLGGGLPILMTAVPPNATDLAQQAGAEIVEAAAPAFADRISALLANRAEWMRRHELALAAREQFDWGRMFTRQLPRLGLLHGPEGQGGRTNPSQNGSSK